MNSCITWYNGTGALDKLIKNEKVHTHIFAVDIKINDNFSKQFATINDYKKTEKQLETDNHIYEVITKDIVKLYFDVDNLDLSREETDNFLTDFVTMINTELNIAIVKDDLLVMCNDKKNKRTGEYSDKIHSLHIIIPKYKMNKKQQKLLVKYLNHTYDSQFEKYTDCDVFDALVYNPNNQFRMIRQSKKSNGIILVDYFGSVIDSKYIKKSRINYVYKTTKIEFLKTINPFENFVPTKQLLPLADDKLIDFILYDDSIDNKKIMNKNRIWKLITRLIMKKNSTLVCDLNKWCEKSSQVADNPRYTVAKNNEYVESIKNETTFAENYSIYKIINEYSTKYNVYCENGDIQYHTQEFLKQYFTEPTNIIQDILLYKNGIIKKNVKYNLISGEEAIINLQTGFIISTNNPVINMYCDNIPIANEVLFKGVENISQAKDKLTEFIENGDKKVMILKSRWGTGKTFHIIDAMIKKYKDKKILMITESNALNTKLCEDYQFISHQNDDYKKHTNALDTQKKVICSIQSLHRLEQTQYDIVIVDEIQSVLNAYSSSHTFKNLPNNLKSHNMYDLLIRMIKESEKSLLCDADIQENYIEALAETIGAKELTIIKNTQPAFADYNINIHTDYDDILNNLTSKILHTDSKIALASASRAKIDELIVDLNIKIADAHEANNQFNKTILTVTSNGAHLYKNGVERGKYDKTEVLKTIDKFIMENDVDLFCYSPTIKTGISFNTKDYFDYTFAFGECNSIVFCEFLQMLFRIRNLKQKTIYIYLKERQFFAGKNKTISETNHIQANQDNLFKYLTKHIELYDDECSDDYKKIQTINLNILQNTKYNYSQNLIALFKYHQLNYVYILPANYDDKCDEIENDLQQAKIIIRNKERDEWLITPIMCLKEFFNYKKQIGDKKINWNDLDDEIKSQYSKTKQLFMIFKITETNIKDFYKEEIECDEDLYIDENTDLETAKHNYTCSSHNMLKSVIDTEAQNKIDTCNNHDFFCKYIHKETYKQLDFVRNIYCDKSIINTDCIQEDNKQVANDKMTIREIITMFELFEDDVIIFKPKTLTNQQFKDILIKHPETIQNWFAILNPKNKKAVFDADNKHHIKQIYHFIKDKLESIDIQLKFLTKNHTNVDRKSAKSKGGKMRFLQTNRFIKYGRIIDESITPSKSIEHIQNQAIDTPTITQVGEKLVYNEGNKTIELLNEKKLSAFQIKIDNNERVEKRHFKNYLISRIVQENNTIPHTKDKINELNNLLIDAPFYNPAFDMKQSKNGKITLDYKNCDISNNEINLKEYDIKINLKTKQEYILTDTHKKMKIPIHKSIVNQYSGNKVEAIIPYKGENKKKITLLAERKTVVRAEEGDDPLDMIVSDMVDCMINSICLENELHTISCNS